MNIINGIVGALIGGSLVWVLGRAYGEGVGAAKSLFVVGKKAGNEDIKLYIDHKIARDGFITKMIFMQGLNDQLDDCIEAIDSMNASRSSAWLNSAFADRKGTISMAATVTGRMARRAETPSRNQNGYETAPALTQSNRDVVEAVKTLGERIDRVAESVKGMKVVMNGRKFVGEIRSDIDDVVGDIIEKGH